MNIKDIRLGAPAAERDIKLDPARGVDFKHGLMEYFVESDAYQSVERGVTKILIGNRGSGKSAIFKVLAARERKLGTIVIEIAPDTHSYKQVHIALSKETPRNWGVLGAYSVAWQHVLYVAAMKELATRATNIKTKAMKRIKDYIQAHHDQSKSGIVSQLLAFAHGVEELKVGGYGLSLSLKTRQLDNLYKLQELEGLLPRLAEVCDTKKIIILVDELDTGWDGSEDAKHFVAGLFAAAMSVNKLSPNLWVMISLRRELYDNIPEIYADAQKVRDLLRYIEWDEAGLKTLIDKRIRAALALAHPGQPAPNDPWTAFFAANMADGGCATLQYILDRTLYRPRELIQFCNQSIEKAPIGAKLIDGAAVLSAEPEYSRDRAQDIAAEYQWEYHGIDEVLETFRGASYRFSRKDLELHCLQLITGDKRCLKAQEWLCAMTEDKLIRVLWRVGFLRACPDTARGLTHFAGGGYLGPHQLSTLNLESAKEFQIHEMFHVHYGVAVTDQ